jgi:hypothetical protein
MKGRRLALIGGMVGISLLSPYALSVLASRFPTSFLARMNATLHTTPGGSS